MSLKKLLVRGSLVLSTLALVACGNGGGTTSSSAADTSSTEETAVTSEDALAQAPTGEKIVLLTNNGGEEREAFILDKTKAAGFDVELISVGGGEAASRVVSEANNPTTNVVWGPSDILFGQMIDAGALAEFTPSWKDAVAGTFEENGYSWPYEIQPKFWVANPEQYNKENSPKSVNDLWEKDEFHGKYTVPTSFGGATNRAIIGSILGQYLDEAGDLGVSDAGWEAITAFFDNGVRTPEGENDFDNMIKGTTPITFTFASGLLSKSETFGEPYVIYFENGQPDNTNHLGVVNSDNPEVLAESMRLADFLGSAEFIGDYAEVNGNILVNKDALDKMVPIAKDVQANYKPQDLDWDTINAKMDEWVAKIELEIF